MALRGRGEPGLSWPPSWSPSPPVPPGTHPPGPPLLRLCQLRLPLHPARPCPADAQVSRGDGRVGTCAGVRPGGASCSEISSVRETSESRNLGPALQAPHLELPDLSTPRHLSPSQSLLSAWPCRHFCLRASPEGSGVLEGRLLKSGLSAAALSLVAVGNRGSGRCRIQGACQDTRGPAVGAGTGVRSQRGGRSATWCSGRVFGHRVH